MNDQDNYFSVDIEASGPIPGEYSMLSLGVCLVEHCRPHLLCGASAHF